MGWFTVSTTNCLLLYYIEKIYFLLSFSTTTATHTGTGHLLLNIVELSTVPFIVFLPYLCHYHLKQNTLMFLFLTFFLDHLQLYSHKLKWYMRLPKVWIPTLSSVKPSILLSVQVQEIKNRLNVQKSHQIAFGANDTSTSTNGYLGLQQGEWAAFQQHNRTIHSLPW